MSRPPRRRIRRAGIIGVGILACAACCAGPLLGIVGGLGVASLLGSYWLPGLLVVAMLLGVAMAVLLVRRRRAQSCRVAAGPVTVEIQPRTREDAPA